MAILAVWIANDLRFLDNTDLIIEINHMKEEVINI